MPKLDKKKQKKSGKALTKTKRSNQVKTSARIKTFSYFVPAPPDRTSSYRELELDKVLYSILENHDLIQFYSLPHGPKGSLIICLLKSKDPSLHGFIQNEVKSSLNDSERDFEIEIIPED